MTTIKYHPATNEGQTAIAAELGKLVLLKERELNTSYTQITDWGEVSALVEDGAAVDVFPIGTILHAPWADVRAGNETEWDFLWRVVHHGTAVLRDGEVVPAMYLQSKLCLPFSVAFDAREAFYSAPAGGLAAGTYRINGGTGYQKMLANTDYEFTLTQDLPEGGQLYFKTSTYSDTPAVVCAFASGSATTSAEECAVTVGGSSGTLLGSLSTAYTANVNHIHRHVLGNNRWRDSDLRQFLNASGSAWYAPRTPFDRPPTIAATSAGFLAGFEADFVDHLAQVAVKTALPNCDGGTSGGTEHDLTYDRVFLPSAEQLNWACTWLGVPYGLEGDPWQYWLRAYGQTPATMAATHTEYCMASMGAESTMRYVFERSAYRGSGGTVASCYASGHLSNSYAYNGYYCAPACCIV